MKLRNKKTGEIFDAIIREKGGEGEYSIIVCDIKAYEKSKNTLTETSFVLDEYQTLTELNDEWEDYKPSEPLIIDPKIRRGIRAWWDMQDNPFKNAAVLCHKKKDLDGFYHWRIFGYIRDGEQRESTDLCFRTKKLYAYDPHHDYTKEELCGEEKTCES